jgi:hypothetical protein
MKENALRSLAAVASVLFIASIIVAPWPIVAGHPLVSGAAVLVFGAPSLGALWMMYFAVRYEAKPLHYVALALVPFFCVWYYFYRYRTGRYLTSDRMP